MRFILLYLLFVSFVVAHPVSYQMNFNATYDEEQKMLKIACLSSSRNKCGLHDFNLLDENKVKFQNGKFPYLKKSISIKVDKKPSWIIFYLRRVPAHTYNVVVH